MLSTALILQNALEFYESNHDGGQYARGIRANTALVLDALINSSANNETIPAEQEEDKKDMLSEAFDNLRSTAQRITKGFEEKVQSNEQSKPSIMPKPIFDED